MKRSKRFLIATLIGIAIFIAGFCVTQHVFAANLEITEVFFSLKEPWEPKDVQRVPAMFTRGQQMYVVVKFRGVALQIRNGKRYVHFKAWAGVTGADAIVYDPFAPIGEFFDPHPEFNPNDAYFWIPYTVGPQTPFGKYRIDLAIEDLLGGAFTFASSTWQVVSCGRDI